MYKDRTDAGLKLAKQLEAYRGKNAVVLAIPRGGVPVGCAVARHLGLPLELLLAKKIGHPVNREYAIGAVSLTERFIANNENIPEDYLESETKRVRERLREMNERFNAGVSPVSLENKILIVTDDGIATGNTLRCTIGMLRKNRPEKIIIAVPVASDSSISKLSPLVDEIICPCVPSWFNSVGAFYENFQQINDEEVMDYLNRFREHKE
jgi:predicted phosphoribosyltransferase